MITNATHQPLTEWSVPDRTVRKSPSDFVDGRYSGRATEKAVSMVLLLALLGFFGLLKTSTAVRNLRTVSQYRQRGATAVGSIVNTREDHSGEWRGDSYYALVQFSANGKQYARWAQLTRRRGKEMSGDSPVGLAVEVVYPSDNPERFLINSDMFESAYRFDLDRPYRQHAVGLLVGMALLTAAIVGAAASMAGETTTASEPRPTDAPSAMRHAAKEACGDGTMTSDDVESFKATLEGLGISLTEGWLPPILMIECGPSFANLEEWLPETRLEEP